MTVTNYQDYIFKENLIIVTFMTREFDVFTDFLSLTVPEESVHIFHIFCYKMFPVYDILK